MRWIDALSAETLIERLTPAIHERNRVMAQVATSSCPDTTMKCLLTMPPQTVIASGLLGQTYPPLSQCDWGASGSSSGLENMMHPGIKS